MLATYGLPKVTASVTSLEIPLALTSVTLIKSPVLMFILGDFPRSVIILLS